MNCEEAIVQHKVCETGKCNIHIDFPFELKKKRALARGWESGIFIFLRENIL